MPFRLIGTIILLLIVTIFAGANLDNRCDINFIFTKVQNVPVFLTAVISFLIGAIIMIPFTFKRKCAKDKKSEKSQNQETAKTQKPSDEEEQKTLFDFKIKRNVSKNQLKEKKEKKSWFGKNKKSDKAETPTESETQKSEQTETKQEESAKPQDKEKSSSTENSETKKATSV